MHAENNYKHTLCCCMRVNGESSDQTSLLSFLTFSYLCRFFSIECYEKFISEQTRSLIFHPSCSIFRSGPVHRIYNVDSCDALLSADSPKVIGRSPDGTHTSRGKSVKQVLCHVKRSNSTYFFL